MELQREADLDRNDGEPYLKLPYMLSRAPNSAPYLDTVYEIL